MEIANSIKESFRENVPLLLALGDPVRQDIIMILIEHERLSVSEITSLTKTSRPAISHHLKILKEAKVVKMKKAGKQHMYYLDAKDALQKLKGLIEMVENSCME
ncbi:ArsR/SmtB family transcription factor [Bacillus marinisedimentorum]|uniref:ArsR/SmtB family transcription factor n=1 Tax=Bacillus marinisedimentorum TaxID=1821260 RepID=UPI0008724B1A|nr:metalloregulator ArsR/SmtB family transcription factor [Bacillus marinisedimentorum]